MGARAASCLVGALSVLAGALSAAEVAVQVFINDPPIPRFTCAILVGLINLSAAIARFVAQHSVSGAEQ